MRAPSSVRTALVIQGPIFSTGRTGNSLHNPDSGIGKDKIVEFDSSEVVNSYIDSYSTLFDVIVVSTWQDEDVSKILVRDGVHIIKSEDTLRNIVPVSRVQGYFGNNKSRQFFTLKKALDFSKIMGIDHVIKVRTDNLVDVSVLLKSSLLDRNKLWFPGTGSCSNYLEDFFFAGSLEHLEELCDSMLHSRSLYKSVHLDMFYKYIKLRLRRRSSSIFDYFPQANSWTEGQARIVNKGNADFFGYFPIEVWNSQVWRGEPIQEKFYLKQKSSVSTVGKTTNLKSWRKFSLRAMIFYLAGDLVGSRLLFLFDSVVGVKASLRSVLVSLWARYLRSP